MKKRAESKNAKVPNGIKLISILYRCNAVLLLVTIFSIIIGYSRPLYYANPFLEQIVIIVYHVVSILGIAYVEPVAEIIGLLQSILIRGIVMFIFAGLYFGAGIALIQRRHWAKKTTITLSVISLALSLIQVLGTILVNGLSGTFAAFYDQGLLIFFSSIIGFIIPAVVLYYLRSSKEVKKCFSQNQMEKSERVKAKETKKILFSVIIFIIIGAGISLFLARNLIIEDYYMATAVKTGDLNTCDKIGDTPDNYDRAACYLYIAQQKQDVSICGRIGNEESKARCYLYVDPQKQEVSICERISNEENKAYCLSDLRQ